MNTIFVVFGLTVPGIEAEFIVSVTDALSTRPLIGAGWRKQMQKIPLPHVKYVEVFCFYSELLLNRKTRYFMLVERRFAFFLGQGSCFIFPACDCWIYLLRIEHHQCMLLLYCARMFYGKNGITNNFYCDKYCISLTKAVEKEDSRV